MKLAIMQPYFMPYLGYWQLMSAVDTFVVYDNVQYTKKGWINRNRFLLDGRDPFFSIPLKKDSHDLNIVQRSVAGDFQPAKLLNQLAASYRKAPHFESVFPLVASIVKAEHANLFDYIHHSIRLTADYLGITTHMVISSAISVEHSLRGEDKVISLCRRMGASTYINAIGGESLYSRSSFDAQGITLKFIQGRPTPYRQFGDSFVPNLSIIDVMMFNSKAAIQAMLSEYDLI